MSQVGATLETRKAQSFRNVYNFSMESSQTSAGTSKGCFSCSENAPNFQIKHAGPHAMAFSTLASTLVKRNLLRI